MTDAILAYDKQLSTAVLTDLLNSGTEELLSGLSTLLKSGDREKISAACLVIRDAYLLLPESQPRADFRAAFDHSPVVTELERLLLDFDARQYAVYTLGKTGMYRSLPALEHAFQVNLQQDPLFLPILMSEIQWISGDIRHDLIAQMVSHPSYLTRWAALEIARQREDEAQVPYLEILRHDASIWVRAEAEFRWEEVQLRQHLRELPRAERRRQRKKLLSRQPLCFWTVMDGFRREHGHTRYDLSLVDAWLTGSGTKECRSLTPK